MAEQEMLPHVCVLVSAPAIEHQHYLHVPGRIVDVRDYPPIRFCQVALDGYPEPIWFEATELTVQQ